MSFGEETGPLAYAHRGGALLDPRSAPENTLAAFARSAALGIRYQETDVRVTADGHLVCFHDDTLERCTNGSGRVAEMTLAELRRARVGGRETIPTLAEALGSFPDACFAIDLKDRAAIPPMARLLRQGGLAQRVCVAGAWDGWLQQLGSQVPGVRIALGWRSLATLISASKAGASAPSWMVRGRYAHVPLRLGRLPIHSDKLVRRAHRLGVKVIVWTVDDPAVMHSLLDAGIDGIISDRPDILRGVLIQRGQWRPMPGEALGPATSVADPVA